MSLLMEPVLMEPALTEPVLTGPARRMAPAAREVAPAARRAAGGREEAEAQLAQAFGFTVTHRGREEELVMGDVTLCCSTTCSCSGGGHEQPR